MDTQRAWQRQRRHTSCPSVVVSAHPSPLRRSAATPSHSGLGAGRLVLIPGWAGHADGLQASRRRLSEVERAEQVRLRLRAGEEAAAVTAAAANAVTEEEETPTEEQQRRRRR
eukprot:COSAG01_NODE_5600_length_4154_cov_46.611344_4_plen_113_part_00